MAVQFQDYYATLGVPRTATQAEIQKAYRQLARKKHPDVDKSPGATKNFQQITEAYEVLKDPETRQKYDTLGANWKAGQDFTPPPGWQQRGPGGGAGAGGGFGGYSDFSDFFESMFGGRGGSPFDDMDSELGRRGRRTRAAHERAGRNVEAELSVPFDVALRGGRHGFAIDDGSGSPREIEVKIPTGSVTGSVLRLRGQGRAARGDGAPGDLLLRLVVVPPAGFDAHEDDLHTLLRVDPSDAVLGAKVPIRSPDGGEIVVTLPPGSSSGRMLRLRGQGLPRAGGGRGDVLLEVSIVVPERPTEAERRAYEELRNALKR
jgi:curved DNA-binding protein